jgi:hypothetical protein
MQMPVTRADRQTKRDEILARHMARAKHEASRTARSLVCGEDAGHASCHGATVCLCECHDPQEDA